MSRGAIRFFWVCQSRVGGHFLPGGRGVYRLHKVESWQSGGASHRHREGRLLRPSSRHKGHAHTGRKCYIPRGVRRSTFHDCRTRLPKVPALKRPRPVAPLAPRLEKPGEAHEEGAHLVFHKRAHHLLGDSHGGRANCPPQGTYTRSSNLAYGRIRLTSRLDRGWRSSIQHRNEHIRSRFRSYRGKSSVVVDTAGRRQIVQDSLYVDTLGVFVDVMQRTPCTPAWTFSEYTEGGGGEPTKPTCVCVPHVVALLAILLSPPRRFSLFTVRQPVLRLLRRAPQPSWHPT